jgi:hypothetical protein
MHEKIPVFMVRTLLFSVSTLALLELPRTIVKDELHISNHGIISEFNDGWKLSASLSGPANSLGVVFTQLEKKGTFSYYYDMFEAIAKNPAVVNCGTLRQHRSEASPFSNPACNHHSLPKVLLVVPHDGIWIFQVKQLLWKAHQLKLPVVFIANRLVLKHL